MCEVAPTEAEDQQEKHSFPKEILFESKKLAAKQWVLNVERRAPNSPKGSAWLIVLDKENALWINYWRSCKCFSPKQW